MAFKFKEGDTVRVKKNFREIPSEIRIGSIPRWYDGTVVTLGFAGYRRNEKSYSVDDMWTFAEQWLEPVEESEDDKFKRLLLS
ncbi:MAG: hypothetical protein ACI4BI_04625 [Anaerotardibacter sp.]